MTWHTDNRYSPNASGATVPDNAPAAYSARWIDMNGRADILPDRQGFAYSDLSDRNRLIDMLTAATLHTDMPYLPTDVPTDVTPTGMGDVEWEVWMRRSGGYVYVDAWLVHPDMIDAAWLAEDEDEIPYVWGEREDFHSDI